VQSYWAYLLVPGVLSWIGLYSGGIHAALALVPIVPFMPAARKDLGVFDPNEEFRDDTLDRFEHAWKLPVQVILFFFGLANAGVPLSSVGLPRYGSCSAGLILGNRSASAMTMLVRDGGLRRARAGSQVAGGDWRGAGIGFTVALFCDGPCARCVLDQAKMGALLSFWQRRWLCSGAAVGAFGVALERHQQIPAT
jgi:NhaA family Na+:H+ antiporter